MNEIRCDNGHFEAPANFTGRIVFEGDSYYPEIIIYYHKGKQLKIPQNLTKEDIEHYIDNYERFENFK